MEHTHHVDSRHDGAYSGADVPSAAVRAIIQNLDAVAVGAGDLAYTAGQLTRAARQVCATAREDGLLIEQVLIRVKDAWHSTPGRFKPRPGGHDPVLDRLVSACIREFYADR